jgi:hypothetical protein
VVGVVPLWTHCRRSPGLGQSGGLLGRAGVCWDAGRPALLPFPGVHLEVRVPGPRLRGLREQFFCEQHDRERSEHESGEALGALVVSDDEGCAAGLRLGQPRRVATALCEEGQSERCCRVGDEAGRRRSTRVAAHATTS